MSDYWHESVEIALNDAGVSATKEQIEEIAGSIAVCHENYGMAHGYDAIPNPVNAEVRALEAKLKEANKHCEDVDQIYRENIGRIKNVDPADIYIRGRSVVFHVR